MAMAVLSALLLVCAALAQDGASPLPLAVQTTSITHVRVIDGTGAAPLEDQTIVLRDGRIAALGASAKVHPEGTIVDGHGETVMPGIINAHGHLALTDGAKNSADSYTRENVIKELRQYERYGVTTMLSLGLNRDLIYGIRSEQRAGALDGASVFVADRGIGEPDGAPAIVHAPDQLYTPSTVAEAQQDVDAAVARHTDFIKMWVDSNYQTKPELSIAMRQAVIAEAHRHQTPVAAHIFYLADAKELVHAGVDVLAHSVRDLPVDPAFFDAVKQHGVFYIPTLTVDESFFVYADQPAWLNSPFFRAACPPDVYATLTSDAYRQKVLSDPLTGRHRVDHAVAEANLKASLMAGVKIAFGTDSGANIYRVPGFAEHHELAMMVESGLTPLQAIHAATETSAELLGIAGKTGTLTPGKSADLILLRGNPAEDIHNTEKIAAIWHQGRQVQPMVPAQ